MKKYNGERSTGFQCRSATIRYLYPTNRRKGMGFTQVSWPHVMHPIAKHLIVYNAMVAHPMTRKLLM